MFQIWHAKLRCAARMLEGEESLQKLHVHWNDHGVIHLEQSLCKAPLTFHLVVWQHCGTIPSLQEGCLSRGSQPEDSPQVTEKLRVRNMRDSLVHVLMHLCWWPCQQRPGCCDHRCCLLQLEELDCVQAADKCWDWKWLVLILEYHHQSPWFIIMILEAGVQQFTFPLG